MQVTQGSLELPFNADDVNPLCLPLTTEDVFSTLLLSEKRQCVTEVHAFEISEVLSVNIGEPWL